MILAQVPGIGEPELYAICAVVATGLLSWIIYAVKLKRHRREAAAAQEKLRAEAAATLKAAQDQAAADAAAARTAAGAAAAKFSELQEQFGDLQQRFTTHREVAERRANDASQQITRLEGELAATREVAAQLVPTQSRIKDLELALSAEQGRVKALEQTVEATNARAADFEQRMIAAQELVLKHKTEFQEQAAELKKVRDEHAAYAAAGGAEAEVAKAREAQQQAEGKLANLQRALKAAEARVEMVQKEFMNAVGVPSAPLSSSAAALSAGNEKKIRELEDKLAQVEAESRKKAREDGYKIAELEYRLSEAVEKNQTAVSQGRPPAPPEESTAALPTSKAPQAGESTASAPDATPITAEAPSTGSDTSDVAPATVGTSPASEMPSAVEASAVVAAANEPPALPGPMVQMDLPQPESAT